MNNQRLRSETAVPGRVIGPVMSQQLVEYLRAPGGMLDPNIQWCSIYQTGSGKNDAINGLEKLVDAIKEAARRRGCNTNLFYPNKIPLISRLDDEGVGCFDNKAIVLAVLQNKHEDPRVTSIVLRIQGDIFLYCFTVSRSVAAQVARSMIWCSRSGPRSVDFRHWVRLFDTIFEERDFQETLTWQVKSPNRGVESCTAEEIERRATMDVIALKGQKDFAEKQGNEHIGNVMRILTPTRYNPSLHRPTPSPTPSLVLDEGSSSQDGGMELGDESEEIDMGRYFLPSTERDDN